MENAPAFIYSKNKKLIDPYPGTENADEGNERMIFQGKDEGRQAAVDGNTRPLIKLSRIFTPATADCIKLN